MFERPSRGARALLVCLDFGGPDYAENVSEFEQLALSAGYTLAAETLGGSRQRPDSKTFAGSGKVEELAGLRRDHTADVVLFNHQLSPAQQRNLETVLECRVIDRTSLILDIFGQRAQSFEGKLQVELAQLQHAATRLVRGWTHLERQKGGIGLRGGPGEKQLELDRRMLGKRMKHLKDQLQHLQQQRTVQRRSRQRGGVFSVSIVGYTNAGKSTLFNRLTHAKNYAADQLFATLDTTSRRLYIDAETSIVISDTVGFIRDLPHTLVAAFQATLEETVQADLLLHVVDSSSPVRDQQIAEVNRVLKEIHADQVPQLLVLNKIDILDNPASERRDEYGRIREVLVSALSGAGFDLLRSALGEYARHSTTTSTQDSDGK